MRNSLPRPAATIFLGMLFAAILGLGAFLRFHDLDRQSFWQDEAHTALYVTDDPSLATVVQRVAAWDLHAPLFYILLRVQTHLFKAAGLPVSDRNLRLLPAILGWLALPAIFLLGCRIFNENFWPAMLMLFLASVNIYGVYYSQELRMYSLVLFLAPLFLSFSLSLWSRPGGIRRRDIRSDSSMAEDASLRPGMAAGFVLTGAGLLYTSLACLFLVAGVGLALLGMAVWESKNHPRRRWQVLALGAAILALYAPWMPVMWKQSQLLQAGVWTGYTIPNPLELLHFLERNLFFHLISYKNIERLSWLLALMIPLAGFVFLDKARRRTHALMFLGFGASFTIYVLATWNKPFHLGRYLAAWWPLALYFPAAGYTGLISALKRMRPQAVWSGAALLALFLFSYSQTQYHLLSYYYKDYQKENWRAAVLNLHAFYQPGDVLLVSGIWHEGCLRYYGAAWPLVRPDEWRAGRLPQAARRLVYVGGRPPERDIRGVEENFQTWPLKNCNMRYYTLELKP